MNRGTTALWALSMLLSCKARPVVAPPAAPPPERVLTLFLPHAEFRLSMQPGELARDGEALSLASAEAEGASVGLGAALLASERVEITTQRGPAARTQVGLALLGVPASMGPDDVRAESGERLLVPCTVELPVPCFQDTNRSGTLRRVYVVERRHWFVAAGEQAVTHAEAQLHEPHAVASLSEPPAGAIWFARYAGASLRRNIPKLRVGPLAPLAEELEEITLTKLRRVHRMQVVARYASADAAAEAAPLAERIVGAWSRARNDPRERLISFERRDASLHLELRGDVVQVAREAAPTSEGEAGDAGSRAPGR